MFIGSYKELSRYITLGFIIGAIVLVSLFLAFSLDEFGTLTVFLKFWKNGWWIILPIPIWILFTRAWSEYGVVSWYRKQEYVYLEVIPPAEVERGPQIMESVFAGAFSHSSVNKFEKYDVSAPRNPYKPEKWIGRYPRGHIDEPAMDGWYYWATWDGVLFKFKPENSRGKPKVKYVNTTWNKGEDVLQIALSPKGRYIYYYPKGNSPIIQYDVKTGKRKVLAWVRDYYFKKYGYFMGQGYGMSISKDGKFLVIIVNGEFTDKKYAFGHPGILKVELPESEREE